MGEQGCNETLLRKSTGRPRVPGVISRFVLAACLCTGTVEMRGAGWRPLWNGRDFSGWSTWLQRPEPASDVPGMARGPEGKYPEPIGANRDPLHVFTIVQEDGKPAIRISGEVFGELRCNEVLRNFRLRLQFKWGRKQWPPRNRPGTPRDSGLLYYVHAAPGAEGRTWARSFELQIQEHDVGDLYAVGSEISVRVKPRAAPDGRELFDYDPGGEWKVFSQVPGREGRCVKQPDNENPTGEWNTVEVVCLGEDILHVVNGKVVMRLHGPRRIDRPVPEPVTSGPVILQSEGAEIFYRDIAVQPIAAMPAEFVER